MGAAIANTSSLGNAAPAAYLHDLTAQLAGRKKEAFLAIFLDAQHAVIRSEIMFHGTKDLVFVKVGSVARAALQYGAHALVVAHNHPRGIATPSIEDVRFTRRLQVAMAIVGIPLTDHLIVTSKQVYSMASQGPWEAPLKELAALLGLCKL